LKGPGSNRRRDAVGNSLRQTVHTHRASVHRAAKLVAALLRIAGVTAGMAESKRNTVIVQVIASGAERRHAPPADASSTRGRSIRLSADGSAVREWLSCRQSACL